MSKKQSPQDMVHTYMQNKLRNPMYCVFCGKPVLMCPTDENGKANNYLEWELKNSAHYKCYAAYMEAQKK
jgi:ferredoxin